MKSAKRYSPEVDAFLKSLEDSFERTRKKTVALYPYNKQTNTIILPPEIEKTLRQLVLTGDKVEAVKRVIELTGAGLRVSKDYVDSLEASSKRKPK
jgi:ribosomal protein L7/L12